MKKPTFIIYSKACFDLLCAWYGPFLFHLIGHIKWPVFIRMLRPQASVYLDNHIRNEHQLLDRIKSVCFSLPLIYDILAPSSHDGAWSSDLYSILIYCNYSIMESQISCFDSEKKLQVHQFTESQISFSHQQQIGKRNWKTTIKIILYFFEDFIKIDLYFETFFVRLHMSKMRKGLVR